MVSETAKKLILENREKEDYLPVKIVRVAGKGYGVVSTEPIANNVLLCSYLGAIGTN